jgi:hypothetical protein
MAYLTNEAVQGPNNTLVWDVTAGGATVFDTVEAGITSGNGGVSVVNHEVLPGPVHRMTVRVTGGPVGFRARGGLQA